MTTLPSLRTALLAEPSLAGLSYALRHLDEVAPGFPWHYGHCETCAIGLATVLWEEIFDDLTSYMAGTFRIPFRDAYRIFVKLAGDDPAQQSWKDRASFIRPEHVADAIDRYLATQ